MTIFFSDVIPGRRPVYRMPTVTQTNKSKTELSDADVPSTNPDEFSDVTLVVEGRKLYTSRAILASASPVWRAMLTSEFKEKTQPEIPLPGKSYRDVCELLLCITPGINKEINGE